MNRDTRFSRDKRLYKDHLDLFFWHGEKKGWDHPGFFVRLTAKDVWLGAGMHHFIDERPDPLPRRGGRRALGQGAGRRHRKGRSRRRLQGRQHAAQNRPRGYDKEHPRAKYLLWEGLPAMAQMTMADAMKPDFADRALTHFRNTWPVGQWLMDHVVD